MIRRYEPAKRVAARLEIGTRRWGGPAAGVDVMGDGRVVAFTGSVGRRPLEEEGDPYAAVERELS